MIKYVCRECATPCYFSKDVDVLEEPRITCCIFAKKKDRHHPAKWVKIEDEVKE